MGLNIGAKVTKFRNVGYFSGQSHPLDDGLEQRFWEFLSQKFTSNEFGAFVTITEQHYEFDVRFSHYADAFTEAGYKMDDMYRAIIDFILRNFDFIEENLKLELYYSG